MLSQSPLSYKRSTIAVEVLAHSLPTSLLQKLQQVGDLLPSIRCNGATIA
jgi:hypothetical protein